MAFTDFHSISRKKKKNREIAEVSQSSEPGRGNQVRNSRGIIFLPPDQTRNLSTGRSYPAYLGKPSAKTPTRPPIRANRWEPQNYSVFPESFARTTYGSPAQTLRTVVDGEYVPLAGPTNTDRYHFTRHYHFNHHFVVSLPSDCRQEGRCTRCSRRMSGHSAACAARSGRTG